MEKNINQTEYRLQLRERILDSASAHFRKCGIKAVKMDDIARQLSISKRTLYELFHNKEELLYECVKLHHVRFDKRLKQTARQGETVIDILVTIYKLQTEDFSRTNPDLFVELKKYPAVLGFLEKYHEKRKKQSGDFLRKGMEEGLFRRDVNYEIVSRVAEASMEYVMTSQMYHDYPLHDIFRNVQLMQIRGICTDRGLRILDERLAEL